MRRGQVVYINDTELFEATTLDDATFNHALGAIGKDGRAAQVPLRFFIDTAVGTADPVMQIQPCTSVSETEVTLMAFTSTFGGDPSASARRRAHDKTSAALAFGRGPAGSVLTAVLSNSRGCQPYDERLLKRDEGVNRVLLIWRGDCTFIEKLSLAAKAGATGIVVVSDEEHGVNPAADQEDVDSAREELAEVSTLLGEEEGFAAIDLDDVVAVLVPRSAGKELIRLMHTAEAHGFAEVRVVVEPEPELETEAGTGETTTVNDSQESDNKSEQGGKILYLNGHPLVNTRILV